MKKQRQYMKIGLAAVLASLYGSSLTAATFNGVATANVIAPLVLAQTTNITFGTVAVGTGGGTVVLDTAGARTVTGDANAIAGGAGAAGVFTINGENAQAYTMSIAAGVLSDGGGNTMSVGTYTYTPPALTGAAVAFNVGATLTLGASQPAGAYSTANAGGTAVVVTANYN